MMSEGVMREDVIREGVFRGGDDRGVQRVLSRCEKRVFIGCINSPTHHSAHWEYVIFDTNQRPEGFSP